MLELIHLVGRLCGVQDLEKGYAVDADHRIIAGDDILTRDIHHLLFHVHFVDNALENWDQNVHARR